MGLQPRLDRLHRDLLLLRLVFWQIEQGSDRDIRARQSLGRLSACPQHDLVVLMKAVGVFDSELCLADATQANDGLWL